MSEEPAPKKQKVVEYKTVGPLVLKAHSHTDPVYFFHGCGWLIESAIERTLTPDIICMEG